ncbi:hypothetical protein B0H16DRAFT_1856022 [Mycena metata]|uniref:Secreted protein n=1 Tax=Mycena metata TaxID=1033252 RepID=A0AAD7DGK8_9AGAR|nr:hypothetical protein B0H16DRAFT_1856022 [Mycena metata]
MVRGRSSRACKLFVWRCCATWCCCASRLTTPVVQSRDRWRSPRVLLPQSSTIRGRSLDTFTRCPSAAPHSHTTSISLLHPAFSYTPPIFPHLPSRYTHCYMHSDERANLQIRRPTPSLVQWYCTTRRGISARTSIAASAEALLRARSLPFLVRSCIGTRKLPLKHLRPRMLLPVARTSLARGGTRDCQPLFRQSLNAQPRRRARSKPKY